MLLARFRIFRAFLNMRLSPVDIAKGVLEAIKATSVTDKPIVAAFVGATRLIDNAALP